MKKKNRTLLQDLSPEAAPLARHDLQMVFGGRMICEAPTPNEKKTATLTSAGRADSQTDCSS